MKLLINVLTLSFILNCATIIDTPLSSSFSEYQGEMIWNTARSKCLSLKMKLPTIKELQIANKSNMHESLLKDGKYYWTSEEEIFSNDYAYSFDVNTASTGYFNKLFDRHVRCIR